MKNLVIFKDDLRCNICNLSHINEMCVTHSLNEQTGEIRHYFELRQYNLNRDKNTDELSQVVDYYEIKSDLLDENSETYLLMAITGLLKNNIDFFDFSGKEAVDDLISGAKNEVRKRERR